MAQSASVSPARLVSAGHDDLVFQLVSLFEAQFAAMAWVERYRLLEQIFDYLEENSSDRQSVVPDFERIVEQLVMRAGSIEVSCCEQAHIYAASRAPVHRRKAKLWFAQNRQPIRPSLPCARQA
jgi:hypothetical protein